MQQVEGKQHDHPYHRGISDGHEGAGFPGWRETGASGKVNGGGETWAEEKTFAEATAKPNASAAALKCTAELGRIGHIEYKKLGAKESKAGILEVCEHQDSGSKRFPTKEHRLSFHPSAGTRMIDFDQDFIATDGDVRFDDREDAGLSIRVPTSMALDSKQGGWIITSEGVTNEDGWSTAAKCCDYSGPAEGETLGGGDAQPSLEPPLPNPLARAHLRPIHGQSSCTETVRRRTAEEHDQPQAGRPTQTQTLLCPQ